MHLMLIPCELPQGQLESSDSYTPEHYCSAEFRGIFDSDALASEMSKEIGSVQMSIKSVNSANRWTKSAVSRTKRDPVTILIRLKEDRFLASQSAHELLTSMEAL